MIWRREEYLAHMSFEDTGREMFCELFGPLHLLEREWREQGAAPEEIALTAFDFDFVLQRPLPARTGLVSPLTPKVLEDTAEHQIVLDYYGRKTKLMKQAATLPLPLTYPVKTMEDWLAIRPWYQFREERVNREALRECRKEWERGRLTILGIPGGFDEPRQLLGEEGLCYAFFDEEEMVRDMLSTMADTCVKVIERVLEVCPIDCLSIHEDLAGKSGPLLGPGLVKEFLRPYYRRVWDAARSGGCAIFSQDSDGNINPVLDAFLDCGVNSFYPFEPMAGMDMVAARRQYGKRFSVKGGIDKFALRGTKADIERELAYKLGDTMRGGGCVFALDHRIPNGVPIENYRYYCTLAREMLGLPPIVNRGWQRMAF